ncbi:MAG: MmcQ/YjbR family DNA-binding protein [bacterium]
MATQEDVRRIAHSLPGAKEDPERFAFSVLNKGKEKGFAWVWLERIGPKKPRVPQPRVLAVRVSGEEDKDFLIQSVPDVFFTEPHYNGFPAILVRLDAIDVEQLETLLIDAWHLQAPKDLVAEYAAARA